MSGKESFPDFSWMNGGSDKSPASSNNPTAPSSQTGPNESQTPSPSTPENPPGENEAAPTPSDPVDKYEVADLPAAGDDDTSTVAPGEMNRESSDNIEANESIDRSADSSESEAPVNPENSLQSDDELQQDDSEDNFIESNTFVISKLIPETSDNTTEDDESAESTERPEDEDAESPFETNLGSINHTGDSEVQVEHLDRETESCGAEITRSISVSDSSVADLAFGTTAGALIGAAAGAKPQSSPTTSTPFSSPFGNSTGGTESSSPKSTSAPSEETAPAPAKTSKLIVILASYASAITIGFILLLIRDLTLTFRPHQLESLPDIPAEKAENLTYVPTDMKLPQGHTLPFGVARRFGNILVEPIKITHEPATFVHYTGDATKTREATAPIWKLWLKLTNVSEDQTIAPLDRRLVLRWVSKSKQNWDFTNQYITNVGAKSKSAPGLQLYYLPASSDWDMKDQFLGKELKPGESYVTYLASSDEGFDNLGDDLLWRVQIRKGYSAKGHGVTTVFEVPFRKEDVEESQS